MGLGSVSPCRAGALEAGIPVELPLGPQDPGQGLALRENLWKDPESLCPSPHHGDRCPEAAQPLRTHAQHL